MCKLFGERASGRPNRKKLFDAFLLVEEMRN